MIHAIEFYSEDRVDIGIGASKDVRVIKQGGFVEHARNRTTLKGHPKPKAVSFELLNSTTLRVTNNSNNVVSLWPGEVFLTVVPGHQIHSALSDVVDARLGVPMRETTITGTVTDIRTETSIDALNLPIGIHSKLRHGGYYTIEQLDKTHSEELLSISGIGDSTLCRIREAVLTYMEGDDDNGL